MHRLWRVLAVVWTVIAIAAVGMREAPATTWAVPLHRGDDLGGWQVVDLGRTETAVHVTLSHGDERRAVRIERRISAPGTPPLRRTDLYRLDPAGPVPDEALDPLAARLTAWHATTPSPPPFVSPSGHVPTPVQRIERVVLDAMAIVWVACLLWTLPGWRLPDGWRRGLTGAVGVGAVTWLLVGALGTAGVWHSNQHGFERTADLAFATPPWAASLGLLHGFGFYTVMTPLVGGGPNGGRDVQVVALALALVSLIPWQLVFHLALRRFGWTAALTATAALAWSPVLLRVAPTEAMYVPALLYLGGAALGTELILATGHLRWLPLALLPLGLAMQTRADLLILAPAAVGWRVLTERPELLRGLLRPAPIAGIGLWTLCFVPRVLDFSAIDKPGDAGRPLVDPLHDPRTLILVLLGALGVLALPRVQRRVPAVRLSVVSAVAAIGVAGWTRAWTHRPSGYDPGLAIHGALDPQVAAPVVGILAAAGLVRLRTEDPTLFAWLTTSLAASLLVYLGRYDCLSTYLATGLATAPLFALAAGALPASIRPFAALAVLAASVTSPVVNARYPKQLQGDVLAAALALPADTTLVWLDDADLPADASDHGWRSDRLPLGRLVGDTHPIVPLAAWLAGGRPANAVFVRTLDCHRPVLSRRGRPQAWLGDHAAPWRYLPAYAASTGPRYAVDGVDDEAPWIHPACAAALAMATPLQEIDLPPATSGSIYEEVRGASPRIGLYRLP